MNAILETVQQVEAGVLEIIRVAARAVSAHSDDFVLVGP